MSKKSHLLKIIAGLSTLLLTACDTTLANLTPKQVHKNPSGMYSLNLKANLSNGNVVRSSVKPTVIVNGHRYPMKRGNMGHDVYTFDYPMPVGSNYAKYYYEVDFDVLEGDSIRTAKRKIQSDLYDIQLINRYVITMESNRGLVGSVIPVTGRGFTEFDRVLVGGVEAETTHLGPNVISFVVPNLPTNATYDVELNSSEGISTIGEFKIDASHIRVSKDALNLKSHERTMLVFQIDQKAPKGGLELNIETDIPDAVIMPDVKIPEGAKTVSVMLEGGFNGQGSLFITAPGYAETTIPLEVRGVKEEA